MFYFRFQENSNFAVLLRDLMNKAAAAASVSRPPVRASSVRRALSQQRNGLSPSAPPFTKTALLAPDERAREWASERASDLGGHKNRQLGRSASHSDWRRRGGRWAGREGEERVFRSVGARIRVFPSSRNLRAKLSFSGKSSAKSSPLGSFLAWNFHCLTAKNPKIEEHLYSLLIHVRLLISRRFFSWGILPFWLSQKPHHGKICARFTKPTLVETSPVAL